MQKTGAPLAISASDCAKPSFQQLTWAATPSSIHPNPNPNGQLALQNCDSEEMLLLSPVPHRMKSLITGKTGVIDMTKCLFSQLPCHNFAEFRQRCLQLVSARIEIEAHVAFSRMQCALFVEIRLVTNARGRGGRAVKHLQLREQRRRVVGRPIVIDAKPQLVSSVVSAIRTSHRVGIRLRRHTLQWSGVSRSHYVAHLRRRQQGTRVGRFSRCVRRSRKEINRKQDRKSTRLNS